MYIETKNLYQSFEKDELTMLMEELHFKINQFGLWKSDHDCQADYISSDIEIVYYLEGGSTTTIGNKQYVCPAGSFLILEPYQLNTSYNKGHDFYSYYYIHFDIDPIYKKEQLLSLMTRHGHLIYDHEIKNFREMFDRLYNETRQKEIGYTSIITSALLRLIVEIIRAQLKRKEDSGIDIVHSRYMYLVSEAIQYIHNHIHEKILLTKMSQDLGVSTGVLYKAFMHELNISPSMYIQKQKIQYAQQKLMLNETLTSICHDLGFSSSYHLSKVFKQVTGLSPREYKKKMKNF